MQTLSHIFQTHEDQVRVRTLTDADGNPWFCCTDVARAVGYKDPRSAVKDWMHERQNINEISIGGKYPPLDLVQLFGPAWTNTALINEPMLYKFLMRCRAPKADAFVEWVSGTVLPSIRKTGGYTVVEPKALTVLQQLELGVAYYKEMIGLAEASGLKDWYTQAQVRRANMWYGSRKAHKALNAISEELGFDVKVRANLTSTDVYNPTNMYHVSVFEEYAKQQNRPFTVPKVAREWQAGVHPDALLLDVDDDGDHTISQSISHT